MNLIQKKPLTSIDISNIYKIYIKTNKIYSILLWNTPENEPINRNAKNLLIDHSIVSKKIEQYFTEVRLQDFTNLDQLIIDLNKLLKWLQNAIDEYNYNNKENPLIINVKIPEQLTVMSNALANPATSWVINDSKLNDKLVSRIILNDIVINIEDSELFGEYLIINLVETISLALKQVMSITDEIFENLKIDSQVWNQLTIKTQHYDYTGTSVIEQFEELKVRKLWFSKTINYDY